MKRPVNSVETDETDHWDEMLRVAGSLKEVRDVPGSGIFFSYGSPGR
jgi:hypothetical protein